MKQMAAAATIVVADAPEPATLRKVVVAKSDDWTAMYIDGVKVIENHRLTDDEIFNAIGVEVNELWVEDDWIDEHGHNFPDKLEDIHNDPDSEVSQPLT
jgi:hypothetical protein